MIKFLHCVYKVIEAHLYNYEQDKLEIEAAKEDMLYGKKYGLPKYIDNVGYISSPTENAVVEYESKYSKTEKWVKVIESALSILKNEHQGKYNLVQYRYFKGLTVAKTCEIMNIHERDFYKWKDDVITLIAILAVQEGLLKVKNN